MEPKYIFAIVALSLFLLLFIIFFVLLTHRRRKEAKLQAWLYKVYSDKNLIKMDYDMSDEESADGPRTVRVSECQDEFESLEEEKKKEADLSQPQPDELYDKIEIEGIEEITGNYKPE